MQTTTMNITKMTSLVVFFCICFIITVASMNGLVIAERVFKVGDVFGWQEPGQNSSSLYAQWATRNRFQVGDSLSFDYNNDSVIEVNKWGYYHCDASKHIVAFNNGNRVFKLDKSGLFYYISGTPSHCKNGQRLLVEVMGLHHHSPPFIAAPPGYLAPSPQLSSGVSVSGTLGSLSMALMATLIALLWSLA
ncbi:hypothetical protein BDE02_03G044200 [Populus trichocarpa]|nr:hypothetical protein BDE02_03G044200 [Populus trichocarpa]